jgi:HEPN domain-containing protein/predicted nucleotidyltransferase
MQDTIEHLPGITQQELELATVIIRDMVEPEMVILFGSYARGNWVAEKAPDGVYYQYQSDLDLLVVTATESQAARVETNQQLDNLLSQRIKTPVSLIAHDIEFFNRRLKKGQYFFSDIQREGIVLFDSGRYQLAEPRQLQPRERKLLAEEDLRYWLEKAIRLRKGFDLYFNDQDYVEAVFLLHQMTERLFAAILLVFTRYKPSTHDLSKLLKRVASIEPRFLEVFPRGTEEQRQRFKLLRSAYVDARYKPSYSISREQLAWLAERVERLQAMTEKFCRAKIDSFE